jgi:beta-N-acetylhexosaminidase
VTAACILGCSGPVLTEAEKAFFAEAKPWGFILFKRNVETPEQVRRLTQALRETVGRPDAPILIDQEGGRVQRMGPPHWPKYPPARAFSRLFHNDPLFRREFVRLGARLMAADLHAVGINVDCVPVLDVPQPGAHDIIGDRAYAEDPETIASLGRAAAEGLIAGGVLPVMKHIPGHGRAMADSHHDLPVVETDRETLAAIDFKPFKANSDVPMGMTAHVIYTAIDRKRPGTLSRKVVRVIRKELGFDGLLMTDDLSMKALSGTFEERAAGAIAAGCDVVLHCNGVRDEMEGVLRGCGKLRGKARRRAEAALARLPRAVEPFDEAAARVRFVEAFGGAVADAKPGPKVGE